MTDRSRTLLVFEPSPPMDEWVAVVAAVCELHPDAPVSDVFVTRDDGRIELRVPADPESF